MLQVITHPAGEPSIGSPAGKKSKRYDRYRHSRGQLSTPRCLDLRHQDLFILIEVEEIKYLLEVSFISLKSSSTSHMVCVKDSLVSVETMLASPYVTDHQTEVEKLCESLNEIEEIVNLWHTAQTEVSRFTFFRFDN